MPTFATPVVEHRPVKVEHSVIAAPEAVMHSAVQGPPVLVRCACGVVIRWDGPMNFYDAVADHFGPGIAERV